jgi:hypothetical protein
VRSRQRAAGRQITSAKKKKRYLQLQHRALRALVERRARRAARRVGVGGGREHARSSDSAKSSALGGSEDESRTGASAWGLRDQSSIATQSNQSNNNNNTPKKRLTSIASRTAAATSASLGTCL